MSEGVAASYAPGDAWAAARAALDAGARHEAAGSPERAASCYEEALACSATPTIGAEAHRRLADVHRSRGDWPRAIAAARRSAVIAAEAGLDGLRAEALNAEGNVHLVRGELAPARLLFERALAHVPGDRVRGIVLQNLGTCAARAGDFAAAGELFATSLAHFRTARYERGVVIALNNVASAHADAGDPAAALPLLAEAGEIARALNDVDLLIVTVSVEAEALGKLGRHDEAERRIGEALGFFAHARNDLRRAECLLVLGDIHAAQAGEEHRDTARRCYGMALQLAESLDASAAAARARAGIAALGAA